MRNETLQSSPQHKVCGYEYTVKRGDSFYLIAQRLGVPLRDLLEANSEVNPARLMVGDVLCIPMEEDDAVTKPAQEPLTNSTKPMPAPMTEVAETTEPEPPQASVILSEDAAVQMETSVQSVTEMVLDALTDETDESQRDDAACEQTGGVSYVVEEGDTAADIQQAADVSRKTLAAANPGVDLDALHAGDRLQVPAENQPCRSARFYRMEEGGNLEATALLLDVSVAALLRANPCLKPSDFKAGAVISVP